MLGDDDLGRLSERTRELEQGDLISTTLFPSLATPESTFHPDSEATEFCPGQEAQIWAAPVRAIATGWGVIVTQTCDLVAGADTEPYIQVAPLSEVGDEELWRAAQDGRDHRIFGLPPVAGFETPAVEPEISFPVEKGALLHEGVETLSVPLSPTQRIHLSLWLARRCGRHAFPDSTEDYVLRPLRHELRKRLTQESQTGAFARCLLGVWATAAEAATIKVCFILNPTALRMHLDQLGTTESDYDAFADQLLKASARRIDRATVGLQIQSMVRTLDRIDAHQLLFEMRQIDMDWLPAGFFVADELADATGAPKPVE
jgi:hypothetical protein